MNAATAAVFSTKCTATAAPPAAAQHSASCSRQPAPQRCSAATTSCSFDSFENIFSPNSGCPPTPLSSSPVPAAAPSSGDQQPAGICAAAASSTDAPVGPQNEHDAVAGGTAAAPLLLLLVGSMVWRWRCCGGAVDTAPTLARHDEGDMYAEGDLCISPRVISVEAVRPREEQL